VAGRFLGRVDFYWDDFGVVGEADGDGKYGDRQALIAEKRRQERLEEAGLVVVRWGWQDLRDPDLLAARVRRALDRGSRRSGIRGWFARPAPRLCPAGARNSRPTACAGGTKAG
jgi:hypothetical protein